MKDALTAQSSFEYFERVPDPRDKRTRKHPLTGALVLSLLAMICGADAFAAIELCGECQREFLKTFLDLPNGIPSHDTIGRIFSTLGPTALQEAFRRWMVSLTKVTDGEVVAIDGKTLRRSFRHAGDEAFVHMVSAWATENRVVLGRIKAEDKSNEIPSRRQISRIPRWARLL